MRAAVDSSESTIRPLTFSRERVSSSSLTGSATKRSSSAAIVAIASAEVVGRVPTYRPTSPVRACRLEKEKTRVGKTSLLAHLLEEARGGGSAEHAFEHAQGETTLVVAGYALAAEAHVVLLGVLVQEAHAPLERRCLLG